MRRARPLNLRAPLLGAAEVAALLRWDARKVAVYARRGALPAPYVWLASGPVWRRADIEAYMAGRRGSQQQPQPVQPAKPVRFVSRHGGLMLFGGPNGTVRFSMGRYETSDPAEIAWLRRHGGYGIDFREQSATPS